MSDPIKVGGGLVVRRCGHLDDWFLIQRAEHEGRQWIQPVEPGVSRFMCSSRISDADVEGSWDEMRVIVQAIQERSGVAFKRCAVQVHGEDVWFWSPRNSRREAEVSLAAADAMAAQFLAEFPERPKAAPEGEPQGEESGT